MSSRLSLNVKAIENSLTPSGTDINVSNSVIVVPKGVSLHRRSIPASAVRQLTNAILTQPRDTYTFIRNIGKTNFDVRSASADSGIFGVLAPGDFTLIRVKQGLDIYVKNLSSSDLGKIETSYWQCSSNAE